GGGLDGGAEVDDLGGGGGGRGGARGSAGGGGRGGAGGAGDRRFERAARPAVAGAEVILGHAQAQPERQGPLAHRAAAVGRFHSTGVHTVQGLADFDRNDQGGVEERLQLGVARLATDEPELS